ncbi:hypothetical protein FB45DRAFT_690387, partial [Roridomyces roridus]
MKKSQFYLSHCVEAASKSPMRYTLGSALVKGGKVISTGFNHQRPNYDAPGSCGTPASMHAEMACIFNATRGQGPVHKQQQGQQQQHQQKGHGNYEKQKGYYDGGSGRGGLDARRAPTSILPNAHHQRPQDHHHHDEEDQDQADSSSSSSSVDDSRGAGGKKRDRVDRVERGSRSRNPKLQGADLYVCRVNKSGEFGCARPCWRCVEWCAWAGVRRIFHWSVAEGRFVCVKVGGASEEDCYQTVADFRFLTG